MNAYPLIPPLEPRHVKELVRQIRVLRSDQPALGPDELAAEWADGQRWRIREHRPTPFAEWLATEGWERGFAVAAAMASRAAIQRAKQRALRAKAKAWKKSRRPGEQE